MLRSPLLSACLLLAFSFAAPVLSATEAAEGLDAQEELQPDENDGLGSADQPPSNPAHNKAPSADPTADSERKADSQESESPTEPAASESSELADQNGAKAQPPYHRPPHAVAVNARIYGEGQRILAEMSEKERETLLEQGMVLASDREGDEEISGYIRAWVIAKQPRSKVFELLIEPSKQSTFLPRLVSSTTVERTQSTELTRFHIRVGLINVHTQVKHQWWPEISRLAWTLDPNFKNGVRHQEGYWNVYSLDERTSLLEYGTILKTSALVPGFVQERLTRSDLPGAMEAMKNYLDSGGTWRR